MSESFDAIADEIALRRASVDDARREHAAGELSAGDLADIEAAEETAIALLEARLGDLEVEEVEEEAAARPRRRRWGFLVVALVAFAAGAAGLVVGLDRSDRPPASRTTVTRILALGELDEAAGQDAGALAEFEAALAIAPHSVEALTQAGWLEFSAGSASHDLAAVRAGEARTLEAVHLAPGNAGARLYYAIEAASTPGDHALAVSQFRVFLRLHPTRAQRAVAEPWLRALKISG